MHTIRYHSEHGVIRGLMITEGHKYLTLVLVEHPVRLRRVLKKEGKHIRNLDDIPVAKVLKVLHRMVKADYGSVRKAPKSVRSLFI